MRRHPLIRIHVLPGGELPRRMSTGAIGYDVTLRALVCPFKMDERNPYLRQTLFDFKTLPTSRNMRKCVERDKGELVYLLKPRCQVLVGIGFMTDMPFPYAYWVAPRSGLATRYKISVTNAPGTVDPDYRGEAGVAIFNQSKERGNGTFILRQGMRIAQIVFFKAEIPELLPCPYRRLGKTVRGARGFGSTGL